MPVSRSERTTWNWNPLVISRPYHGTLQSSPSDRNLRLVFDMSTFTSSFALLTLVLATLAAAAQGPAAMKAVATDDGVWLQDGDTKVAFYQRQAKAKGEVQPLPGPVEASPWIDVSGTFGQRVSGVSMLIHPTTPGFPQPWVLRRSGSMQNAVYPGATPISLPREKPLVLRYRLLIHRGAVTAEQVDLWQKDYSLATKP